MIGLVIPVEGKPELRDIADDGDGSAYRGLAPLYPDAFDSIRIRRDVVAYVGDSSLLDGSPVNREATDLVNRCYQAVGSSWPTGVFGLAVVLGMGEWGNSLPVPDDFVFTHYPELMEDYLQLEDELARMEA